MPAENKVLSNPPVNYLQAEELLCDRYQINKILGQGNFGAAYLATDVKLKRSCVIKQMLLPQGRSTQTLARHYHNFEQEASLLVQLNQPGHPNIPEIYDYFTEGAGVFLVMKYIEGQSFKTILEPEGTRLPWQDAVEYMIPVCKAVHYMHTSRQQPVIHRDIKPANILLGNDKRVWLVDFGLAKARPVESDGDLQGTQISGSLGYTPLEQWLGQTVPASDVYAIGVTLHHMVTGLHPARNFGDFFDFEKLQNLHKQLVPIRQVDKKLPQTLESIIIAATDVDPARRPTPEQLYQELKALISGPPANVLFTFKNGLVAKNTFELATLCLKYSQEAQAYLLNGDFERWFHLINRNDLAEAAARAVKEQPGPKKALRHFVKLISPNRLFIKTGHACKKTFTVLGMVLSVLVLLLGLAVTGFAYGARLGIQEYIGYYNWQFEALNYQQENQFTEAQITTIGDTFLNAINDGILVDFQYPNKILLNFNINDIQLNIEKPGPAASAVSTHIQKDSDAPSPNDMIFLSAFLNVEDGKPHFYFTQSKYNNDISFWVLGHLSLGINRGVDMAFDRAKVRLARALIDDNKVTFSIEKIN